MEIANIILVGFMATGKSSVGKRLAKIIGWDFIDTDLKIEELTDMTVSDIFRKSGEERFRSEEEHLIRKLEGATHCVIATGGGTVLNPNNLHRLKKMGVMIALYASVDTILERVGHRHDRPLLKSSREDIEQLWRKRQSVYNQAEVIIDTTDKDIDQVTDEVIRRVREAGYELNELAQD